MISSQASKLRPKPSELPWFYKVKIRPEYDPAILVTRIKEPRRRIKYAFETEEQARRDTRLVQAYLETAPTIGRTYLLPKLRDCKPPDRPCGMTICRVCIRQYRRALVSETLPHLHRKLDQGYRAFHATFVYSQRRLRFEGQQLKVLNQLLKLPHNLRVWLSNNGLGALMISGNIEFDWNKAEAVWEPHCHLIIMSENKQKLSRAFRKYFASQKQVTKTRAAIKQGQRISEVELVNLPRALAYTAKFTPKLRKSRKRGEVRLRKRPELEDREKYTALKWLGILAPDDLAVRRKLHLIGSAGRNPRIVAADD